jgi:hypothetical protein
MRQTWLRYSYSGKHAIGLPGCQSLNLRLPEPKQELLAPRPLARY